MINLRHRLRYVTNHTSTLQLFPLTKKCGGIVFQQDERGISIYAPRPGKRFLQAFAKGCLKNPIFIRIGAQKNARPIHLRFLPFKRHSAAISTTFSAQKKTPDTLRFVAKINGHRTFLARNASVSIISMINTSP